MRFHFGDFIWGISVRICTTGLYSVLPQEDSIQDPIMDYIWSNIVKQEFQTTLSLCVIIKDRVKNKYRQIILKEIQ